MPASGAGTGKCYGAQKGMRTCPPHWTSLSIEPGKPWQNGKEERFNGTVRDECLNLHLFASRSEARVRLEAFRQQYNHERPHSRLGYQTPTEFKQAWQAVQQTQQDSHIPT